MAACQASLRCFTFERDWMKLPASRRDRSSPPDAAILLLVFAAGYGLRAWISARRRRDIRKSRGH